jgi:hypothetical protein
VIEVGQRHVGVDKMVFFVYIFLTVLPVSQNALEKAISSITFSRSLKGTAQAKALTTLN